jgi:protein pelota
VRLIHADPVTGLFKLRIETPSDLWRIARFVRPGEPVGGSTTRRDPEAPEDVPAAQRERRRVWIVVRAEQVEFHDFSGKVRVTGPIVEGPFDIGRHHTIELGEGDEVTVVKRSPTAADRTILEEGIRKLGEPTILIASVDWGESAIVRLRGRSIEKVAEVKRGIAGKRFKGSAPEKDRAAYLSEIAGLLSTEGAKADAVLLAGPGFLKESVAHALAERSDPVGKKLKLYATSESGLAGVDELLRSGRASELLRATVAAEEAQLVEELMSALGGHRAAVGLAEVPEAAQAGAVETLLVSESLLAREEAVRAMDAAREGRAKVLVVRDASPPGKRLAGLGGIGAILRYDWRPTGSPAPRRGAPRSGA